MTTKKSMSKAAKPKCEPSSHRAGLSGIAPETLLARCHG